MSEADDILNRLEQAKQDGLDAALMKSDSGNGQGAVLVRQWVIELAIINGTELCIIAHDTTNTKVGDKVRKAIDSGEECPNRRISTEKLPEKGTVERPVTIRQLFTTLGGLMWSRALAILGEDKGPAQ